MECRVSAPLPERRIWHESSQVLQSESPPREGVAADPLTRLTTSGTELSVSQNCGELGILVKKHLNFAIPEDCHKQKVEISWSTSKRSLAASPACVHAFEFCPSGETSQIHYPYITPTCYIVVSIFFSNISPMCSFHFLFQYPNIAPTGFSKPFSIAWTSFGVGRQVRHLGLGFKGLGFRGVGFSGFGFRNLALGDGEK